MLIPFRIELKEETKYLLKVVTFGLLVLGFILGIVVFVVHPLSGVILGTTQSFISPLVATIVAGLFITAGVVLMRLFLIFCKQGSL